MSKAVDPNIPEVQAIVLKTGDSNQPKSLFHPKHDSSFTVPMGDERDFQSSQDHLDSPMQHGST